VPRAQFSLFPSNFIPELHDMIDDTNLIGDFTRPFCLPIISGRHVDLRYISVDTLRKLLLGEFIDHVASFKVIDCRYPYEFSGGHICDALNLFTQDQIISELMAKEVEPDEVKRNILVFHCEFSSERGPKL
jgi:M-phase inducer phosphatase 2